MPKLPESAKRLIESAEKFVKTVRNSSKSKQDTSKEKPLENTDCYHYQLHNQACVPPAFTFKYLDFIIEEANYACQDIKEKASTKIKESATNSWESITTSATNLKNSIKDFVNKVTDRETLGQKFNDNLTRLGASLTGLLESLKTKAKIPTTQFNIFKKKSPPAIPDTTDEKPLEKGDIYNEEDTNTPKRPDYH